MKRGDGVLIYIDTDGSVWCRACLNGTRDFMFGCSDWSPDIPLECCVDVIGHPADKPFKYDNTKHKLVLSLNACNLSVLRACDGDCPCRKITLTKELYVAYNISKPSNYQRTGNI